MTIVVQTEIHLLDYLLIQLFDCFEHFVMSWTRCLIIFTIRAIPKDL